MVNKDAQRTDLMTITHYHHPFRAESGALKIGFPWMCRKRRKHCQAYKRNDFQISVRPGCSSVAYDASEEIGPFCVNKTGSSLYLNPDACNRDGCQGFHSINIEFYIAGESYAGT
ncbi:cathepsin A [Vigna unguiculata]|uniref:Cathepsin A n=1 Tax=Vigna unguiculata TaxID=3917 RepID=A0A4D6LX70_VIGUN|nr:cathepsin A [Vigna unguiculata]